jgi:hypothetical protein
MYSWKCTRKGDYWSNKKEKLTQRKAGEAQSYTEKKSNFRRSCHNEHLQKRYSKHRPGQ